MTIAKNDPKSLIILAARKLILDSGFSAVTLQSILTEANVTKGKFFHYFTSKEEVFTEVLKHVFSCRERLRYEELVKECPKTSSYEKLIWLLERTIAWHREGFPEFLRLCVFATVFFAPDSNEILEIRTAVAQNTNTIKELIEAAQAERDLPQELSARFLSLLLPSAGAGGNTLGFLADVNDLAAKNVEQLKTMLCLIHKSFADKPADKGGSK